MAWPAAIPFAGITRHPRARNRAHPDVRFDCPVPRLRRHRTRHFWCEQRYGRHLGGTVRAASGFSSLLLKTEQPANVPIYEHLGLTRVAYTEAPPLLTPSWVLRSGAQA
jgi:hypothetical protein